MSTRLLKDAALLAAEAVGEITAEVIRDKHGNNIAIVWDKGKGSGARDWLRLVSGRPSAGP
jgi:hypothetical protein